ncbi:YibE/F family protein [Knoellia subterranea]|uniref:YibE/F family protein n=1 Tax=Knoellia subterranea TaxID=184882 RepID=UPI000692071A|nr:YibE/F family protein [Knoellia subterranea]
MAASPEAVPDSGRSEQFVGVVESITKQECPPNAETGSSSDPLPGTMVVNGCGTAEVKLTDGPDRGLTQVVDLPNGPGAPALDVGDDVVLASTEMDDGTSYDVIDHQRSSELWLLAAAFALAVIAFGRWRGLSALFGLAVTFALLLLFVVPAILAGQSPLLVAIVGSSAIMLTVLYLTHGIGFSTSVAVLGTLGSLVLTGALSAAAVRLMHLTGFADDSSTFLATTHSVNMQGLLLAGIIIGTLGVLDDVTVTQAATVTEVARANPDYGTRELYRAGTRVGRAHIASVINTIILAYAGSSLPLLILISASNSSLSNVLTTQVVSQEIVRSVVATLGLIAAVPITTALAALTARHTVDRSADTDGSGRSAHHAHG